jgi:hypothetical protein
MAPPALQLHRQSTGSTLCSTIDKPSVLSSSLLLDLTKPPFASVQVKRTFENTTFFLLREKKEAMSWQAYVDDQLIATRQVNKACIIGLNGGMWAQSAGFAVSVLLFLFLASNPC